MMLLLFWTVLLFALQGSTKCKELDVEMARFEEMKKQARESRKSRSSHGARTPVFVMKDMRVVDKLVPVHDSEPAIIFWRPQKVGSSTILSLLVSYGYRYNILVRRKSAFNSMCIKAAKCALNDYAAVTKILEAENGVFSSHTLKTHLTKYVEERMYGAGGPSGMKRTAIMNDDRAETQLYRISTSHQMCNLPPAVIRSQLQCLFTNNTHRAVESLQERGVTVDTVIPFTSPHKKANTSNPLSFEVKEIYVLREPMARAVSVYYFWGELFKLHRNDKHTEMQVNLSRKERRRHKEPGLKGSDVEGDLYAPRRRLSEVDSGSGPDENDDDDDGDDDDDDYDDGDSGYYGYYDADAEPTADESIEEEYLSSLARRRLGAVNSFKQAVGSFGKKVREESNKWRLGNSLSSSSVIKGTIFTYHGNESTVPPVEIAMAYARRLPYVAGMPGPSYTWSAFAGSAELAIEELKKDRIMTIVTERLDESLVVATYYMGWSLADVVVTAPRKALSSHPKHKDWPTEAVEAMEGFLERNGETAVYKEAVKKLDQRIVQLKSTGVDFDTELALFRSLRSRVRKVSLFCIT